MCQLWQGCGAVSLDGKLYVIGGYDGKKCMDSVERYNPATNEWVFVAPMSVRRRGCVTVIFQDRIFAMGGYELWLALHFDVGTARVSSIFVEVVCALKPVAGRCDVEHHRSVEVYDPARNRWTMAASMNHPRSFCGASVLHGKIVVAGGPFPSARDLRHHTAMGVHLHVVMGNEFLSDNAYVFFPGGWDGSRALDEVEAYNPSTDSWQLLTPMPYKCHGLCLGVANGQLFTVGGWDGWSRNRLDAAHVRPHRLTPTAFSRIVSLESAALVPNTRSGRYTMSSSTNGRPFRACNVSAFRQALQWSDPKTWLYHCYD